MLSEELSVEDQEKLLEGPDINIDRLMVNNQIKTEWKRSTPLKTYSKKMSTPGSIDGKSRYGRSHKPKLSGDFLSTDKKVSHYLKIDTDNQMHYFKMIPYTYKKEAKPAKAASGKRGRGRPRKDAAVAVGESPVKKSISFKLRPSDLQAPAPTSTHTLPLPTELMNLKAEGTQSDTESVVEDADWNCGDLAWANIGGFPYWPCTLTKDPFENVFRKNKIAGRGRQSRLFLHVRFFGDKGRRSWVQSNRVMPFQGLDAFQSLVYEICTPETKKRDLRMYKAFLVTGPIRKAWQAAVSEAESLMESPRSERIMYFHNLYPPTPPPSLVAFQEEVQADGSVTVVVPDEENPPNSTSAEGGDSAKKKRGRKKKIVDVQDDTDWEPPAKKRREIEMNSSPKTKAEDVTAGEDKEQTDNNNLQTDNSVDSTMVGRRKRVSIPKSPNVLSVAEAVPQRVASPSAPLVTRKKVSTSTPSTTTTSTTAVVKKKLGRPPLVGGGQEKEAFRVYRERLVGQLEDHNSNMTREEAERYLRRTWAAMSTAQKARYFNRARTVDESMENDVKDLAFENNSEETSGSQSPVVAAPSVKTQAKRIISLFAGVKADKVCQVCFKGGEIMKCRGPCSGHYHTECAAGVGVVSVASTETPGVDSLGETPQSKKKGKRGRPKKPVEPVTPESPHKGPGRPRKYPSPVKTLPVTSTPVTPSASGSSPKKRGRPRKSPLPTDEVKEEQLPQVEVVDDLRSEVDDNKTEEPKEETPSEVAEDESIDLNLVLPSDSFTEPSEEVELILDDPVPTPSESETDKMGDEDSLIVDETIIDEESQEDVEMGLEGKEVVIEVVEVESFENENDSETGNPNEVKTEVSAPAGEEKEGGEVSVKDEDDPEGKQEEVDIEGKDKEKPEDDKPGKKAEENQEEERKDEPNVEKKKSSEQTLDSEEKTGDMKEEEKGEVIKQTEKEDKTVEEKNSNAASVKEEEAVSKKDVVVGKGCAEVPVVKNGKKNKKDDLETSSKSSDTDTDTKGKKVWMCKSCSEGKDGPCFVCGEIGEPRMRCCISYCGKMYHATCVREWPQSQLTQGAKGKLVLHCPQHACHTCISDNPAAITARFTNDKLVRCVKCPTSYHYGNFCIPAGSDILSSSQIMCPKHYVPKKKGIHHVNAAWCFICAMGGSLICCDLCPTSFHAECLKISPPEGSYICEDCETGRYPLFGEIVWVKLGSYRWWPAKILFPSEVPANIRSLPHSSGEFAVKFFGSHDYYWVNRGRVFLYHEGDGGKVNPNKSRVDEAFVKGIQEASHEFAICMEERATREATSRPTLKPPKYVKIHSNKMIGNVRNLELDSSNMTPCDCQPTHADPCGPESDCLNRLLMLECNPQVCPAGEKCRNQHFEKRVYPSLAPFRTDTRGWGLKTLQDLKKGDFVIEYVGEMIDEAEYKRRLSEMQKNKDENYYFLTIDKDRMLDAGPKGNMARFMNHSCDPNCETQKWTVNGDTRVGLFALKEIKQGSELVFNYNLETIGNNLVMCKCGAPNCIGFIGAKQPKPVPIDDEKKKAMKKKRVKKPKPKGSEVGVKVTEDKCFTCDEGGELLLCDHPACPKAYHLSCLGLTKHPAGGWVCPWHQCSVCSASSDVQRCSLCINSYCSNHAEGNIVVHRNHGRICFSHNMSDSGSDWSEKLGSSEEEVKPIKKRRSSVGNRNSALHNGHMTHL